jgi:hypothetical protein
VALTCQMREAFHLITLAGAKDWQRQ